MKNVLLILLSAGGVFAASPSTALFNSLDPRSVAEALAFYELYGTTQEGNSALSRAAQLLQATGPESISSLVFHVNRLKGSGAIFWKMISF